MFASFLPTVRSAIACRHHKSDSSGASPGWVIMSHPPSIIDYVLGLTDDGFKDFILEMILTRQAKEIIDRVTSQHQRDDLHSKPPTEPPIGIGREEQRQAVYYAGPIPADAVRGTRSSSNSPLPTTTEGIPDPAKADESWAHARKTEGEEVDEIPRGEEGF